MKNNKGISLIVLVITIIVMIILAGAIILTLNNSGIIGKASEAVDLSNKAQLKQIAQTYYAEYIIESPSETAHKYVTSKMRAAGIDEKHVERIIVYDDGKTIVGASKIAVKLFEAGVPVGTKVSGYDISGNEVKSYTTDGKEYETESVEKHPQTVNVATEVSWTYMGISDEGEALIVFDLDNPAMAEKDLTGVYSTLILAGAGGYNYGPETLNTICDTLYSTEKGKARSINYNDVLTGLKYDGPKSQYTNEAGKTNYLNEIKTVGELMAIADEGNSLYVKNSNTTYTPSKNAKDDEETIKSYDANYIMINVRAKGDDGELVDGAQAKYVKADKTTIDTILGKYDINFWIADTFVNASFKNNRIYFGVVRGNHRNISYNRVMSSFRIEYRVAGENGDVAVRPVVELADGLTFTYANGIVTLNDVE